VILFNILSKASVFVHYPFFFPVMTAILITKDYSKWRKMLTFFRLKKSIKFFRKSLVVF